MKESMMMKTRSFLVLAATLMLSSSLCIIQLQCSEESNHSSPTTLAQWYAAGVAAKFIISSILDELRTDNEQKLEAAIELDKKNLTPKELIAKKLAINRAKEEFKTRTDAVSKMIFGSLKLMLVAWYESANASMEQTASIANAFNSGLKLWILKRTLTRPMATIMAVRDLITLKTSYPYELAPIKPSHTTALYCGPKDPYCLHGSRQATLDENIAQFKAALASWMPLIADVITGIAFAYIGSYVGKAAVSLTTHIGETLLPIVQKIGFSVPISTSSLSAPAIKVLQKGIKRYVSVETRNTLKNELLDLMHDTESSQERAKAESDIKYGFNLRTVATKALPAHLQFIEDFLAA